MNAESLWDVKDLAALVKTTPDAVYRWVEPGLVPHLRIGRSIRFDPAASWKWLATRAVPTGKVR